MKGTTHSPGALASSRARVPVLGRLVARMPATLLRLKISSTLSWGYNGLRSALQCGCAPNSAARGRGCARRASLPAAKSPTYIGLDAATAAKVLACQRPARRLLAQTRQSEPRHLAEN